MITSESGNQCHLRIACGQPSEPNGPPSAGVAGVTPGSAFRAGSGAHRSASALPAGVRKPIRLREALTYSVAGVALLDVILDRVSQVSVAIRCRDDIRAVQFQRLRCRDAR